MPPNGTALYVEDNTANQNLMKFIIDKMDGVTLKTAHNAELGLMMARETFPNLILMDINLPGMNGIDALKQLQGAKETSDIPVIAVTAAVMKRDIEKGKAAGF